MINIWKTESGELIVLTPFSVTKLSKVLEQKRTEKRGGAKANEL